MKKLIGKCLVFLTAIAVGALITGCACTETTAAPVAYKAPAASKSVCPRVAQKGDVTSYSRVFPNGDMGTGIVLVEKVSPVQVTVGQPFDAVINVTNLTDCPLENVVLVDNLPAGLSIADAKPAATVAGGKATWNLGELAGHETKSVSFKATANAVGEFMHCSTVDYVQQLCMTVAAVQPALQLEKSAPAEVVLCDNIPVTLVVKNVGTGNATNVVVTDTLPTGLSSDGKQTITFNAGTLAAGEAKTFNFIATAAKTGSFENVAVATADANLKADAKTTTVVRQAVLTIAKAGTETEFVGRMLKYQIAVGNTGDIAATNVVVTDTVPAGTSFVSASDGGTLVGNAVVWNMASLAPNASKTLGVVLRGEGIAKATNTATIEAACAAKATASFTSDIKGIPAILLEVIDLYDPIPVGETEVYEITVTNQGSTADTNIVLVCSLEDSQAYVSSTGQTPGVVDGNKITFKLPHLAAKGVAKWRVSVKATKAGDVRFSVAMNSDQLTRSVNETEATYQY